LYFRPWNSYPSGVVPYSGNAIVAEFLDCLQDAVRDRLAFYQLTAEGQHRHEATDGELYDRDPEAWNAYLAEGNAKQARKRVSADAIVRDSSGRILLVDPTYKPDWDLPGGMAEANEPPRDTARRELREELGLDASIGRLLCVSWAAPRGPWDDLLNLIFDGGVLTGDQAAALSVTDDELRARPVSKRRPRHRAHDLPPGLEQLAAHPERRAQRWRSGRPAGR
jgi:8-oxo-dGTP diphosphatase